MQRLLVPQLHLQQTGLTYKYTRTVRNIVTNYNNTVQNPDLNQQCVCNQYDTFIDPHYGHVLTGDLNIFKDQQTRNLLKKRLNYRLPQKVNKDLLVTEYSNCVETTTKTKKELFKAWKQNVLITINHELDSNLRNMKPIPKFNSTYLKEFQKAFVIAPVDKASKTLGLYAKYFI